MTQIDRIQVKNFKSLYDAEIVFPKDTRLTVLIGLNGSGKSTVLHLLDFIGELFRGNVSAWFQKRSWGATDVTSKLHSSTRRQLIEVTIEGATEGDEFTWHGVYNPVSNIQRCTSESFSLNDRNILSVKDGRVTIGTEDSVILFAYFGSIFSALKNIAFKDSKNNIGKIIGWLSGIHSFDMLAPRNIRNRSRRSVSIGMSGESLAGFIGSLSQSAREEIMSALCLLYPFVRKFDVKATRGGWNEIGVWEYIGKYANQSGKEISYILRRQAQHANDGTLRIMAILASLHSDDNFVLFDEIENGFNPSIIKSLIQILLDAKKQIVITTHSPEILQYIPDDIARKVIKFVYRDEKGATSIVDFFNDGETSKKLTVLSPGEVFLDTDLDDLSKRLGTQVEDGGLANTQGGD